MVDKSKLPKDVEEEIQSLASDVYMQVEDKLTHLVATAVKLEMSRNSEQQNKEITKKEQSLHKDFTDKQKLQTEEINQLKQALVEKQTDEETSKQHFQVELTQNTINYTETIEQLEKELEHLKRQSTQKITEKKSNDHKLEDKLLETEQKLNDASQEVDGLNGRIMVLTAQEQSLIKQLSVAKEQEKSLSVQHAESINEVKKQANTSAQQQIDALAEKLKKAQTETNKIKTEVLKSSDQASQALQKEITQLLAQAKKEQGSKAELQQKITELKTAIDSEKSQNKLQNQAHQDALAKLTEQQTQKDKAHQSDLAKLTEQQVQNGKVNQGDLAKLTEQQAQKEKVHQAELAKLTEQQAQKEKVHQAELAKLTEQQEQKEKAHQVELATLTGQKTQQEKAAQDALTKLAEQQSQKEKAHKDDLAELINQLASAKQQQREEVNAINEANEQAKKLQSDAQQKIIELEENQKQLSQQLETEKKDVKLYQEEVSVLNEQVKVAQDGQENILQRFNSNREKQETENNKVRETIKFLRDENHQLISDNNEQKAQFTDQAYELEHKLTEYRLKFEYAQKQLTK